MLQSHLDLLIMPQIEYLHVFQFTNNLDDFQRLPSILEYGNNLVLNVNIEETKSVIVTWELDVFQHKPNIEWFKNRESEQVYILWNLKTTCQPWR